MFGPDIPGGYVFDLSLEFLRHECLVLTFYDDLCVFDQYTMHAFGGIMKLRFKNFC